MYSASEWILSRCMALYKSYNYYINEYIYILMNTYIYIYIYIFIRNRPFWTNLPTILDHIDILDPVLGSKKVKAFHN